MKKMKKYLLYTIVLSFFFTNVFSQGEIINKGVDLYVADGSYIYLPQNETMTGNYIHDVNLDGDVGFLNLKGKIMIGGDFVNNSGSENFFEENSFGNIIFNSEDKIQNITGNTLINFTNLTFENKAVKLGVDINISGILEIKEGTVRLDGNDLTLTETAEVKGRFNDNSHIITDTAGTLYKVFDENEKFTFPVGSLTAPKGEDGLYAPFTVEIEDGDFIDNYRIGVNTINQKHPDYANVDNYINRYWTVKTDGLYEYAAKVTYKYNTNDIVGEENLLFGATKNDSIWQELGEAKTWVNSVSGQGITALNDYTAVARPTAPEYTINFFDETTNENVSTNVQYTGNTNFKSLPTQMGKDSVIKLIPTENVFFKRLATDSTITSNIFELNVPDRPEAPYVLMANKYEWAVNFVYDEQDPYAVIPHTGAVETEDGLEFSKDEQNTWKTIKSDTAIDASGRQDIAVRIKATEYDFCSYPTINLDSVFVSDALIVFDAFSPNGDGKNDFFIIQALDLQAENEVAIYNSTGILVFAAKNYQNNWDGTSPAGKDLPMGSYYYIIKSKERELLKGAILLVR